MSIESLLHVRVDPERIEVEEEGSKLDRPASLLREGKLVAFPTETVYGLGANAFNDDAVKNVFRAKGRPADNPLIVHVDGKDMLKQLLGEETWKSLPASTCTLIDHFWPGPLTVLVPMIPGIAPSVSCGQPLLAVRSPDHPVALSLIRKAGVPVAAPSANVSGRPSPTAASHVINDLQGKIACVVDGGRCEIGVESTVVDATQSPPLVLRPGGVSLEQLRRVVDVSALEMGTDAAQEMVKKPMTPGLKYKHYSPNAKVMLVGSGDGFAEFVERVKCVEREYQYIGLIRTHSQPPATSQSNEVIPAEVAPMCVYTREYGRSVDGVRPGDGDDGDTKNVHVICDLSPKQGGVDVQNVAQSLYGALRELDYFGVDLILVEKVSVEGTGLAVMNRLAKAAIDE